MPLLWLQDNTEFQLGGQGGGRGGWRKYVELYYIHMGDKLGSANLQLRLAAFPAS
jgi:hypothetical protein